MDTNLAHTNEDVLSVSYYAKEMGWNSIVEPSFQRILYLSKVLYTFIHGNDEPMFGYLHFSAYMNGPYSDLIRNSIIALLSHGEISEKEGLISFVKGVELLDMVDKNKKEWIRSVLLLLGKYGEERIFGFVINDPTFDDAIKSNSTKELDMSIESETVKKLQSFKQAFEETVNINDEVDDKKYIDLYFDYVFGQIIRS
jgi:hypothetical protein